MHRYRLLVALCTLTLYCLGGCSKTQTTAAVNADLHAKQWASLETVFYRGNPMPPMPDETEQAEAMAQVDAADAYERDLLTELYPDDPVAWALAVRDTDSDGLFDYRISDYYGRFMEGDTDLDGDGVDNVLDNTPYSAANNDANPQLPASVDWSQQGKSEQMVRIQRELFEKNRIVLVERSADFTPELAQSVYDTVTRVYRTIFDNQGILPTLRVISTESSSLIESEDEEGSGDFAQVLAANQTMEIYQRGIDAAPVIQLGYLAHEIGHNVQFAMDYNKQRQVEIMRRNYYAASRFHNLIEPYGWTLVYYDEDSEVEFVLFRPQYISQEPYEYLYKEETIKAWEDWLTAIYNEVGEKFYLTDERLIDQNIMGDYSMSGPWEWYSDHIIAYVYMAMLDSLTVSCAERDLRELADAFQHETVQHEWPYYRFENARGADIQMHMHNEYPLNEEDTAYLIQHYLLTQHPGYCQPE